MEYKYISRRKLKSVLQYITARRYKVCITDDHNCSTESMRFCNKYTGIIKSFSITSYEEDAAFKLIIEFEDDAKAEIWLSNEYYLEKFNLVDKIIYATNTCDGTYSYFIIDILDALKPKPI